MAGRAGGAVAIGPEQCGLGLIGGTLLAVGATEAFGGLQALQPGHTAGCRWAGRMIGQQSGDDPRGNPRPLGKDARSGGGRSGPPFIGRVSTQIWRHDEGSAVVLALGEQVERDPPAKPAGLDHWLARMQRVEHGAARGIGNCTGIGARCQGGGAIGCVLQPGRGVDRFEHRHVQDGEFARNGRGGEVGRTHRCKQLRVPMCDRVRRRRCGQRGWRRKCQQQGRQPERAKNDKASAQGGGLLERDCSDGGLCSMNARRRQARNAAPPWHGAPLHAPLRRCDEGVRTDVCGQF